MMYHPTLFVHWKQARLVLIPFIVAAFGLPLLVVQGLGGSGSAGDISLEAYWIVASYQIWLPYFPLLAGGTGAVLALTSWNWDHQLGHVYALSLPIARWEYVMLKMGAGVTLALVPAAALWLGAQLASASVALPEGLHAYPNHLALRFFLAILLTYALFFAMGAGTIKTTAWIVSGWLVFLVAGNLLSSVLGMFVPALQDVDLVRAATRWMVQAGGPFEVFTGNWSLIDV